MAKKNFVVTKVLKKLVIEEATNLKKYATIQEISRLNLDTLDPNKITKCIYGQMTGNCESERANILIKRCATRVYKTLDNSDNLFDNELNGAPTQVEEDYRLSHYTSPIENFIFKTKDPKKNELLISFIKGEIDELIL